MAGIKGKSGVYKRTLENKENMRKVKTGKPHILTEVGKKSFKQKMSGENNPKWVKDRNKLVVSEKNTKIVNIKSGCLL